MGCNPFLVKKKRRKRDSLPFPRVPDTDPYPESKKSNPDPPEAFATV
jgi:hypothetical protein